MASLHTLFHAQSICTSEEPHRDSQKYDKQDTRSMNATPARHNKDQRPGVQEHPKQKQDRAQCRVRTG
jgi:hypothetical protein